ncbi:SgcJ/EcaC family oxidoreductase [Sphingobacterium psychroaquaticum]|uniref:SgcJ/EcaC family oxidoreductase n=1 Tax=Sphingobacterium psychroaquaticum TaxID=561061 RepID=UPI00106A946C|nr:SgcJ/EcaC family oxidoreductase [Sphingobacterium psychroaquaticum]QBQ41252.1 SgcJ/EcaC family oxidoreductase [Sphingobacterium psychroaquaticum]
MMIENAVVPADVPRLFAAAWNERRADKIADLFVPDADFINVVGIWWENKVDIQKAHEYGLTAIFGESHLTLGKVKVKMLSSEIAVVHARFRLAGQRGHGQSAGLRQNLFLFVIQRLQDRWLAVSAQNTDIVIGAETNIRRADGTLVPTDYRPLKENQTDIPSYKVPETD